MSSHHRRTRSLPVFAAAILVATFLACLAQPATASQFDIYIANYTNGTVYEVPDNFGGAAVGPGQIFANGYSHAYALATSGNNVYVGDVGTSKIYSKAAGAAGPGTGTLFATASGTLFDMTFADSNNLQVVGTNSNVQVFNSSGTPIGTYGIGSESAGIEYVPGVGVYIAHPGVTSSTVQFYTGSGTTYTDSTPGGLAGATYNTFLEQIVKGPDGMLYSADFQTAPKIYRIDPTSGAATTLFSSGTVTIGANTYPINPVGVGIGPDNLLYFTDYANGFLFRSNLDGSNPQIVATGFSDPTGIAFISVPEPTSLVMLGIAASIALAQTARCRRRPAGQRRHRQHKLAACGHAPPIA